MSCSLTSCCLYIATPSSARMTFSLGTFLRFTCMTLRLLGGRRALAIETDRCCNATGLTVHLHHALCGRDATRFTRRGKDLRRQGKSLFGCTRGRLAFRICGPNACALTSLSSEATMMLILSGDCFIRQMPVEPRHFHSRNPQQASSSCESITPTLHEMA